VRVLDAACGSGGHALALARWGYDVTGATPSPVMIALAQQKPIRRLGRAFVVSDLAALGGRPRRGAPTMRYCALGNSLPHLLTQGTWLQRCEAWPACCVRRPFHHAEPELRPALGQAAALVLLRRRGARWPRGAVWRFADYDQTAGRIAFHIALFRKREGAEALGTGTFKCTRRPAPSLHADLLSSLAEAVSPAFAPTGGWRYPSRRLIRKQSGDLVVIARKAGS